MRILYIHQYFKTRAGSGQHEVLRICSSLGAAGHTVTLITGVTDRSDLGSDRQ